ERFAGLDRLDAYFAMARGAKGIAPLELTKWFDTNYHYLVPELGPRTDLRLADDKPVREYAQARSHGIHTRPSLLGLAAHLTVSTSCSLLHVPLDLAAETSLAPELAARLAFARQKLDEVVT